MKRPGARGLRPPDPLIGAKCATSLRFASRPCGLAASGSGSPPAVSARPRNSDSDLETPIISSWSESLRGGQVMLALLATVLGWVGTTHIHLSPSILELLSGAAVPLAVGFLTKLHASSAVKAILNLVLSAIAGGLAVATTAHGDVVLSTWLLGIGQTFLYSIVSYYGVWQHTVAPKIQQSTPNFGIGTPEPVAAAVSRDNILPVEVAEPADATGVPTPPVKRAAKKTTARKRTTK